MISNYIYYETCFPSDLRYSINYPSNHSANSQIISWFLDVVGRIFRLICLSAATRCPWLSHDLILGTSSNVAWLLPLKWQSLGDWSCHVGIHRPASISASNSPHRSTNLCSHHPLSSNHWGMKRVEREEKRRFVMSLVGRVCCPLVVQ